jgi:tetratricopeptide (TPR) repeat protein
VGGVARLRERDLEAAEQSLRRAATLAARTRNDRVAALAWIAIVEAVARQMRFTEAYVLLPVAENAVMRAGGLATELEREDPIALYRRAVELRERSGGATSWQLVGALCDLGLAANYGGDRTTARQSLERAIAIAEALYGTAHPELVRALVNLAVVALSEDDLDAAAAHLDRAEEVIEALGRRHHAETAYLHHNRAELEAKRGRYDAAIELQERALDLRRAQLGDDHVQVADSMIQIAFYRRLRGEPREVWAPLAEAARAHYVHLGYRITNPDLDRWVETHWQPAPIL